MNLDEIRLEPVTEANWRECAALTVHPEQKQFVADVTYYLCMCNYGDLWKPYAVTRDGKVVAFAIWAVDDDASRWIGGVVVDAEHQRQGIGRELVRQLRDRLIAVPGTPNVALSYQPENTAARDLYLSLGFVETGETDGDEVVARWTPGD
ncbi:MULTISPECIES: GNAT family N-acetyltransferase [Actinoplanes]|uniref:GNAT family N-acetyltransferase n=1 Tax=Actinoplanes TaxID=1865 RepID=UPI0005F2DF30|nr:MULTISPECIES: GNAT family N-acetyltransferase [Actinoplanes]GLY01703.1 spermidine acetyltransferase [Actinoplanes sp. NBRC 101535]